MYNQINILTTTSFCEDADVEKIFGFLGNILIIIKIVIPIILIIVGMISLVKAMMSSENDVVKKATTSLLKKACIAVVIFFIPSIVNFIMTMVGQDSNACLSNFLSPGKYSEKVLERKISEAQKLLKEGRILKINGKDYVVKVGDTIESIAKENNMDVEQLINDNNLTNEFTACKLSELTLEENCDFMKCEINNMCTQIDGTWFCCMENLKSGGK